MATAQEVRNYFESKYVVHDVAPYTFKFLWNFTDIGRDQLVFISVSDGPNGNDGNLEMFSAFAGLGDITPEQALNSGYKWGVRQMYQSYGFTYIIPLADLDANEIERPLWDLAFSADSFEKTLSLKDEF